MRIDRWEMKKNTVKLDVKKSSPVDGKIQIKNGGILWNHVWEGADLLCVVNSMGAIRLD